MHGRLCFATDKESLVKNLVLIDGLGRAGKFFLGKIVSGFKKIEYFQYVSILEHLPYIERLGGITEDAAIALLKVNIDEHAYNMRIGRNFNLRYGDASSLYNSYELNEYLKRGLKQVNNEEVINAFRKDGRYSLFVTHENLPNIGLFFKAYPSIKILNLIRHPVDVAHSWLLRGWGSRFGFDPLSFIPVVKGKQNYVPWYASDWKDEYEKASEIDRIIKSIAALLKYGKETYDSLDDDQKKRILVVSYENLVEQTNEVISLICSFLETEPSDSMPQILSRERCPGRLPEEKRKKKAEEIGTLASKDCYSLLMKLAKEYKEYKEYQARLR